MRRRARHKSHRGRGWLVLGLFVTALVGLGLWGWLAGRTGDRAQPAARPARSALTVPENPAAIRTEDVTVPPAGPAPQGDTLPLGTTSTVAQAVRTNSAVTQAVETPPRTNRVTRGVSDVLEAQIALACQGISPGSIDGQMGSQTRAALLIFQQRESLRPTGWLDPETRTRLRLVDPVLTQYPVKAEDLRRLMLLGDSWYARSVQSRLDYETLLELVAEKSWSHPNLIQRLNPQVVWSRLTPGLEVRVPRVGRSGLAAPKAAMVRILLSEKCLQVYDAQTNLVAHYPCSIARQQAKRPVGLLWIKSIIPNPHYVFDPENFPESAEAQQLGQKLVLPPGPNNPVGTVWLGLDRPGYGIHGTPRPEEVGRTESHGCFRLANWNAEHLAELVVVGTPVMVLASNPPPTQLVQRH